MIYLDNLIDRIEIDLDSLSSLIELSKGADMKTHNRFIAEYDLMLRIYNNIQAIMSGNEIDLLPIDKDWLESVGGGNTPDLTGKGVAQSIPTLTGYISWLKIVMYLGKDFDNFNEIARREWLRTSKLKPKDNSTLHSVWDM